MANVAQQVEELTPEQKQKILSVGKKYDVFGYIILAVMIVFCVGAFIFTYFQPEAETPASRVERLTDEYEEKQAKCEALEKSIEALETNKETAQLQLSTLRSNNFTMVNGELVVKELTDEQKARVKELEESIVALDGEILRLLEDRQKASAEEQEAYDEMMQASTDLEDVSEDSPDKWNKFFNLVMIAGAVMLVLLVVVSIARKIECPYYSDAKWRYIKNSQ